jgi:hypothetical protein
MCVSITGTFAYITYMDDRGAASCLLAMSHILIATVDVLYVLQWSVPSVLEWLSSRTGWPYFAGTASAAGLLGAVVAATTSPPNSVN